MAVPPKLPMLSLVPSVVVPSAVVPAIVPSDDSLLRLPDLPKPPRFDFAPSPALRRASLSSKPAKTRPPKRPSGRVRIDLSPRLELRVAMEREE